MQFAPQTRNHGGLKPPWFTFFGSIGLTLLFLVFGAAPEFMLYDRHALAQGEVWRLFTGHLVHLDQTHLIWNLGAFVGVSLVLESLLGWRIRHQLTVFLIAALGVDLYLWAGRPDITYYCGLSALLNAQLAACLFALARRQGPWVPLIIGFGALTKIVVESERGSNLLSTLAWPTLPDAHLAGFIWGSGACLFLISRRVRFLRQKRV